ncbi:MAG TPA: hypothetical protein VJN89_10140 [Candidatus Acidoferrum sp.]|nr:hypothetical protein [Candidatus Acidoferrum sp.]
MSDDKFVAPSGTILVGAGREIRRMPDGPFVQSIEGLPARMASRLAFMTSDHHAVRDFVVREMPRQLKPLSPQGIALVTGLDLRKVSTILSDLERNLFFLVRNQDGDVSWAFPVTTSTTPINSRFRHVRIFLARERRMLSLRPSWKDASEVRNCECASIQNVIIARNR